MRGAIIEAYEKTRHFGATTAPPTPPFTQSTEKAVDSNGYDFVSVQVLSWNLTAGDQFEVFVEEANVNEDSAYAVSPAAAIGVIVTGGTPMATTTLQGFGRFLRLRIAPTIAAGNVGDLRVVFAFKQL